MAQLTPADLEGHLQAITEKFRSGVHGKVREAIDLSVAPIPVGGDGSLMSEMKPEGTSVTGVVARGTRSGNPLMCLRALSGGDGARRVAW